MDLGFRAVGRPLNGVLFVEVPMFPTTHSERIPVIQADSFVGNFHFPCLKALKPRVRLVSSTEGPFEYRSIRLVAYTRTKEYSRIKK